MAIKFLKITGAIKAFTIDGGDTIECRPTTASKPCVPEDYFDIIEECKVCGRKF